MSENRPTSPRRFDADTSAAGAALDMLSLHFNRAGFFCHKRARAYQTIKVYVDRGVLRPLLNPRLGRILRKRSDGQDVELEIYFYVDDYDLLEQQLRPIADEHTLPLQRVALEGADPVQAGMLRMPIRLLADGTVASSQEEHFDALLRQLHASLA